VPEQAAKRQRSYKRRRAAGLAVLAVAIPVELLAALEDAGLAGATADDHAPELEDVVVGVLTGLVADLGDASPRGLRLR
jgi:4'-phosphopantetheinyl transferase EntD